MESGPRVPADNRFECWGRCSAKKGYGEFEGVFAITEVKLYGSSLILRAG